MTLSHNWDKFIVVFRNVAKINIYTHKFKVVIQKIKSKNLSLLRTRILHFFRVKSDI